MRPRITTHLRTELNSGVSGARGREPASILTHLSLVYVLLSGIFFLAPTQAQAQYDCTPAGSPSGSACKPVRVSPWRWAVDDFNAWFNSETEARQNLESTTVAAAIGPSDW